MSAYAELPYFSMEEFNTILKEKAQLDRRLGQLKAAIKKTMEAFAQGLVAGGTAGSLEQLLNEGAIMPEQLRDLLHNNKVLAAKNLKIGRTSLYRKMKQLGIE